MANIVICEFMDDNAVDWMRTRADIFYDPGLVDDEPRLFREIAEAHGLIVRSSATVNQRLLDAGPKLKVIGRLGVGLERFDLPACAARKVKVLKADGANALSVVEYVMSMTAALLRGGAYHATDAVAKGEWPRQACIGAEMAGKTLGILGLGCIGRQVAARAAANGLRVLACDPYIPAGDDAWTLAERVTQDELLARSDILTLHVPLTEETRGIIDGTALAAIKLGSLLINSARGGVADENAVADAVRSGTLGGAAIDVFAEEPLSAKVGAAFIGLRNVILTPHIAGVTLESNERVSQMIAETVVSALQESTPG